MAKLYVVSELFYPEESATAFVMTKIVNKLTEKYDEVEVLRGTQVYDKIINNSKNYYIEKSVKINTIKSVKAEKNNLIGRTTRFLILSLSMFFVLLRKVKKGDKVLIVTNPAPIIILMALLKRLRKIDLIILVHDIFPENTIPGNILKSKQSFVYRILLPIFNRAYSKADKLIVVGRDMKEVLFKKIKKYNSLSNIVIIENWSENENIRHLEYHNEKIIFQFAGNLGRVQGLMKLLEIIAKVNNPILQFHFVGEGAIKKDMVAFVEKNGLSDIIFKGAYKREEQIEILNDCDISIVTLSEGMFGLGVPSKTYNILAAGKPILYIGDSGSEVDLMVKENNIGFSFNDEEHLIDFLSKLTIDDKNILKNMGEKSRVLAENVYAESIILNKYKNEI